MSFEIVSFLCSSISLLLIRPGNISGDCGRTFINLNFVPVLEFLPIAFVS